MKCTMTWLCLAPFFQNNLYLLQNDVMAKKDKSEKVSKKKNHNDYSIPVDIISSHEQKLDKKFYEKEIDKCHVELVKLQEWIKNKGLKVVVIFEGR